MVEDKISLVYDNSYNSYKVKQMCTYTHIHRHTHTHTQRLFKNHKPRQKQTNKNYWSQVHIFLDLWDE